MSRARARPGTLLGRKTDSRVDMRRCHVRAPLTQHDIQSNRRRTKKHTKARKHVFPNPERESLALLARLCVREGGGEARALSHCPRLPSSAPFAFGGEGRGHHGATARDA